MKKLALWAPACFGLSILFIGAGCSKAPETKTDVATNAGQPTKVGGESAAKTNADTGAQPAKTDTGTTKQATTPPVLGPTIQVKPAPKTVVKNETKGNAKPAATASHLGSAESQVVGSYKGKVTLPPMKADDPNAKMAQQMVKAMADKLSLELKSDKTFTMTVMFPVEGKWERSGGTLLLHAEKIMGKTLAELKEAAKNQPGAAKGFDQAHKPMKFKVGAGGKTLTAIPEGPGNKGSMVFTKQ